MSLPRTIRLLALALLVATHGCAARTAPESPAVAATDVTDDRILVTVDAAPLRDITDLSPSGRLDYLPPAPGELREAQLQRAQKLATTYDMELEQDWPIPAIGVYCFVFRLPDPATRDALIAAIAEHPDVESVQPMQFFETRSEPLLDGGDGFAERLAAAHRVATGSAVEIAVIDSGADLAHEDLEGADIRAIDLVDGGAVPAEFHGTAVVGIIAASRNDKGTLGYAPDARVLLLRACWQAQPHAEQAVCNSFTLAKALSFALETDAAIVNMSISGPRDPLLERLGAVLLARDRLLVAAGESPDTFPASIPGSLLAAQFIAEPAHRWMTLLPGDRYALRGGSSISAARLSAIAALLKEMEPQLTAAEFRAQLSHAAHPLQPAPVMNLLHVPEIMDAARAHPVAR